MTSLGLKPRPAKAGSSPAPAVPTPHFGADFGWTERKHDEQWLRKTGGRRGGDRGGLCGPASSCPWPPPGPRSGQEALRMPVATWETTVSVFPALRPARVEPGPLERSQRPATLGGGGPHTASDGPVRPRLASPLVSRARLRRSRPQTDTSASAGTRPTAPRSADRSSPPARRRSSGIPEPRPACEDCPRATHSAALCPIGMALTAFEVQAPPPARAAAADHGCDAQARHRVAAAAALAYGAHAARPRRRKLLGRPPRALRRTICESPQRRCAVG